MIFLPSLPFQTNYTLGIENQNQYILRVRVKHSSQRISLQSSDNLLVYHPFSDAWLSIGSPSASPFIVSLCRPTSPVYYVQLPLAKNPLETVQSIRHSFFSSSSLSFYISLDQKQLSARIGPFYSEKEASFLLSSMASSMSDGKVVTIEKNTPLCLLDLNSGIYIQKTISDQTSTFSTLLQISPQSRDGSIQVGNYSYYGSIWIHSPNNIDLSAVNHIDMETYLKGVVPAEISANWHMEALKSQAITARTFALKRAQAARKNTTSYYDVTDDTYCQVYLGTRQFKSTNQAVEETKDLVLTWNQQLITSPFHSCSGGMTESNANAWNSSPYPYLQPVDSPGEEISPHYSWYKHFTKENFHSQLQLLLKEKENIAVNTIEKCELQTFENSHRVRFVNVFTEKGIVQITGLQFQYYFNLKSSWFGIFDDSSGNRQSVPPPLMRTNLTNTQTQSHVYLYGKGWGHGVGLPQYGAQAAALRGEPFSVIVTRYYRDVSIASMQPFYQQPSAALSQLDSVASSTKDFSPTEFETYSSNLARLSFSSQEIDIQSPHPKIEIGSHPTIDIAIETGSDVFGVTFYLYFAPSITDIQKETCKIGSFLSAGNVHVNSIIKKESTQDGVPYLHVALSREGKENGGVSGSGTLLSFQLETLSIGSGSIYIDNATLLDAKLNPIRVETSPLEFTVFKTDRDPPTAEIVSHPDPISNQQMVQFRWTGEDIQTKTEDLFYSYQLNIEPWSPFSAETSKVLHITEDGEHIFRVKARDSFGNVTPEPASYVFTIDTKPPKLLFDPFPDIIYTDFIDVSGSSEYNAKLTINNTPIPIGTDGSFSHRLPLHIGSNTLHAEAVDLAGNKTTIEYTLERKVFEPVFIWLQIGNEKAIVNQESVLIDCKPFTTKGRTMIPLRFIAESFGANVDWYEDEQKISIQIFAPFTKKIDLWLHQKTALIDNKLEVTLDVEPFTIPPGRTVVPLRFIAETFHASIEWHPQDQSIEIVFPKKSSIFSLNMVQNWFEKSFNTIMDLFNGRG
jgi:stage II sporulation protein D